MSITSNRLYVGLAAGVVVVAVSGTAAYGVVREHKEITVSSDGTVLAISGFHATVEDALDAAEVEVGEHDEVQPALKELLESGDSITVRRAQPFSTADGPVWSVEDDLASVLADTGVASLTIAENRDSIPLDSDGNSVQVIVDKADPQEIELDENTTVADALDAAKIEVSPLDMVAVSAAGNDLAVEVTTQKRGIEETKSEVPFAEERQEDPELYEGTEEVIQEGVAGERTIKTYRHLVGGEVVVETQISDEITRQPVAHIVRVGTKERPAETVQASTGGGGGSYSGGDPWAALAQCESGGNPSANTGNGFYGMYQFTQQTWESVGGSGLPSDASAEEQTARAQALQERSGWGQWPGCASAMGLR